MGANSKRLARNREEANEINRMPTNRSRIPGRNVPPAAIATPHRRR
jgi:hypothetical protein